MKLGGSEAGCMVSCDICAIKFSLKVLVVELSCHPGPIKGEVGGLPAFDKGVPCRGGNGCARGALFNVYMVRSGIS